MDIAGFCQTLDRLLKGRDLRGEGLEGAIKAICLALGVSAGEVALFLADERGESLGFLWPRELRNSGTIPLSSKESLAARTFRDGSGRVNNRFSATRHASIFEAFPLQEQACKALPIQKIISVPLVASERTLGVLQICRKAVDVTEAGPDFSREELKGVAHIARTLARHL